MKKILIILLGAFLIVSCSKTPQQQAEKSVQKFLEKENKESGDSYSPVKFNKLDTISLDTDEDYRMAKDSLFYYKNKLTEKSDQKQLSSYQQGAKRMKGQIEYLESFYKNIKYRIHHTYKTGNGLHEQDFYLNYQFNVVDRK